MGLHSSSIIKNVKLYLSFQHNCDGNYHGCIPKQFYINLVFTNDILLRNNNMCINCKINTRDRCK